ncbi:MAG TPA: large-conductance mechanosensitive channel protein MscL [Phycisphaerales bacterium]|nr:large-conductance mechanosensitive channel protein MscL [Phycisphaerales bacterium]HRQ74386.1 large-conductance mechanosensitive channel protein MscL [Phycisphaerales bacterium]
MGFINDFKEFAVKGNAVDMAVGLIIGAAFGKVVSSLVNDIIMPPIGMLIGGMDFGDLAYTLKEQVTDASGAVTEPAVAIKYGAFLSTTIDFVIVAMTIFIVIRMMSKLKFSKMPDKAAP